MFTQDGWTVYSVFCFGLIYFFICLLFSCLPFYQPFVHLIHLLKKTVTTTTTKTTTKCITISRYRASLVNEKTIKQFYSKKYMLSTVIAIIKSITVTISQNDIKYYLWKKGENITKPEEHLYLWTRCKNSYKLPQI